MKKPLLSFLLIFCMLSTFAQNNILALRKKHKSIQSFYAGKFISLETIDKNYAEGLITKITKDSLYIRHFEIEKTITAYGGVYFDTAFRYTTAIHYKEIGAIVLAKKNSNAGRNGTILMIAGGGVLVLGAVNGLYRGDPPRNWFKPSGYITAGVLTGLGYLMKRSSNKKYVIGKKYQLKILEISAG